MSWAEVFFGCYVTTAVTVLGLFGFMTWESVERIRK